MAKQYNQMTFLYFESPEKAKELFSGLLELEMVDSLGWIYSWKIHEGSYLCAVSTECGTQDLGPLGDGIVISLVVEELDEYHRRFKENGHYRVSEIREFYDAGLRLFSFRGPQNFVFELREFFDPRLRKLYGKCVPPAQKFSDREG